MTEVKTREEYRKLSKEENNKNNKFNPLKWKLKHKIIAIILLIITFLGIFHYLIPTVKAQQPLSFLILGTDSDEYRVDTFNGTKPQRTDAIMVATFNPKTYQIEMTSIPRDTYMDYSCSIENPDTKENVNLRGPINDLYELSGKNIGCVKNTISNFLNIPIDYYALIDMTQMQNVIDKLGGIEVQVHAKDGYFCQVTTDVSKKYCFTDGKIEKMDGEEAVVYSRFRKDSEQDYGRGVRQQQVISAISSKLLAGNINIDTILSLFNMFKTDVQPAIMIKYFEYIKNISQVINMIEGNKEVRANVLPNEAWERISENIGFSLDKVNNNLIKELITFIQNNPTLKTIPTQLFIKNHQFYNENLAYGVYVAKDDERYDISNALRKNLNLPEETPPEYQYEIGRIELPYDEALLAGDEGDYNNIPDENTKQEEQPTEEKQEEQVDNIPVITGIDKYKIYVGEKFTHQLQAIDKEDGNVTIKEVSSNLDITKPGIYTIVYVAEDSKGNKSQEYIVYVTVVEKEENNNNENNNDNNGNTETKPQEPEQPTEDNSGVGNEN